MTLQQLRYVCMVEKCGSITKAAQALYVSQPSISSLIHSLEDELGITIFLRSPMGVTITEEGRDLIRMANSLLNDADHIDDFFRSSKQYSEHQHFLVSSQHYNFVVNAFADLINETGAAVKSYVLGLNQTSTADVIKDVSRQRSSVGVLYIPSNDRKYMERILDDQNLEFHSLAVTSPHIFIARTHPLAKRSFVQLEDLAPYPCIVYQQNDDSPSFYSEEILLPGFNPEKIISISDLFLSFRFLMNCNAYDIGTGILSKDLTESIAAIPIRTDSTIDIGYIIRSNQKLGPTELRFLEILKEHIDDTLIRPAL